VQNQGSSICMDNIYRQARSDNVASKIAHAATGRQLREATAFIYVAVRVSPCRSGEILNFLNRNSIYTSCTPINVKIQICKEKLEIKSAYRPTWPISSSDGCLSGETIVPAVGRGPRNSRPKFTALNFLSAGNSRQFCNILFLGTQHRSFRAPAEYLTGYLAADLPMISGPYAPSAVVRRRLTKFEVHSLVCDVLFIDILPVFVVLLLL